jgi:hypothetical protein
MPALPLLPDAGVVPDTLAARPRRTWRPWTICLPCMLALAASGLFLAADGAAAIMGSWDTPEPGLHWIKIAAIGHSVLAVACVVALCAGIKPSRRPAAAVTAWLIIPVGFAWLLLVAGRLASGSWPPWLISAAAR